MKVPPKGDPQRPLFVAARSMQGLGILHLLACGLLLAVKGTRFWLFDASILVPPGVSYILFSTYIMRRRFWAVIAALVVASVEAMFYLLGFIGMIILMVYDTKGNYGIGAIVMGLFLAAVIVLIGQLTKSIRALKADKTQVGRGFVPVLMAQAEPPNDEQRTTDH